MHIANIVATDFVAKLANSLKKRQDLNVANGATHLGDHNINFIVYQSANATFNLVSDMRNHLNRTAEVVAASLGCQNSLINRTSRCI